MASRSLLTTSSNIVVHIKKVVLAYIRRGSLVILTSKCFNGMLLCAVDKINHLHDLAHFRFYKLKLPADYVKRLN